MQCATCDDKTAPTRQECVMRMMDGRAFTDYRPRCAVQADFYKQVGSPYTAYESRMYLQKNAESIMQIDRSKAEAEHCVYKGSYETYETEMPHEAVVRCTPQSCTRHFTPAGPGPVLGDKREYL